MPQNSSTNSKVSLSSSNLALVERQQDSSLPESQNPSFASYLELIDLINSTEDAATLVKISQEISTQDFELGEKKILTKLLAEKLQATGYLSTIEHREYKADFYLGTDAIVAKISSPSSAGWESHYPTTKLLDAKALFRQEIDKFNQKRKTLKKSSESSKSGLIIGLLVPGQKIYYKNRIGIYKEPLDGFTGIWAEFNSVTEPVNQVEEISLAEYTTNDGHIYIVGQEFRLDGQRLQLVAIALNEEVQDFQPLVQSDGEPFFMSWARLSNAQLIATIQQEEVQASLQDVLLQLSPIGLAALETLLDKKSELVVDVSLAMCLEVSVKDVNTALMPLVTIGIIEYTNEDYCIPKKNQAKLAKVFSEAFKHQECWRWHPEQLVRPGTDAPAELRAWANNYSVQVQSVFQAVVKLIKLGTKETCWVSTTWLKAFAPLVGARVEVALGAKLPNNKQYLTCNVGTIVEYFDRETVLVLFDESLNYPPEKHKVFLKSLTPAKTRRNWQPLYNPGEKVSDGKEIGEVVKVTPLGMRVRWQRGEVWYDWDRHHKEIELFTVSQPPTPCPQPPKPPLPENAPTAIVLCAGGGGVEAGMIQAGIRPVVAVELDTAKPELSEAMSDLHEQNFTEYGCRVVRSTVQDVVKSNFADLPQKVTYLHASTVCSNFSNSNRNGEENPGDIELAEAVAQCIEHWQPDVFTLEQVEGYLNSQSWQIIKSRLQALGYHIIQDVLDLSYYGIPQSRKRLFVIGSKWPLFSFPPKNDLRTSWYEVIGHLIAQMPESTLTDGQIAALKEFQQQNFQPLPLLIQRACIREKPQIKLPDEPSFTLTRMMFTDDKGANRTKFADIWLPDGTTKSVTLEAAALLQGFPEWYDLGSRHAVAGSIVGYAVPPKFVTHWFRVMESQRQEFLALEAEKAQIPQPEVEPELALQVITELVSSGSKLNLEQTHLLMRAIADNAKDIGNLQHEFKSAIASKHSQLRLYIHLLDIGEGYKHLGFANMTDLFKSQLMGGHSRSKLQKEWQAAKVDSVLGLDIGTIPQDHAQKLFELVSEPSQMQSAYFEAQAKAQGGKLTSKIIAEEVSKITGKPSKKPAISRCGSKWVDTADGSYYRLNLLGIERNFHAQHRDAIIQLEKQAEESGEAIETLIIKALMTQLTELQGTSDQQIITDAIALVIDGGK